MSTRHLQQTVDSLREDFEDTVTSLYDIINNLQHMIRTLSTEVQSLRAAAKESDETIRNTRHDLFWLEERTSKVEQASRRSSSPSSPPRSTSASRRAPSPSSPRSTAPAYKVNSWRPQTLIDEPEPLSPRPDVNIGAFDVFGAVEEPKRVVEEPRRAKAVSAAKRWQYRLTGRCVRYGSYGHWVDDCRLLPTKPQSKGKAKPQSKPKDKARSQSKARSSTSIGVLDIDETTLAERRRTFAEHFGPFKDVMPEFYAYQMGTRVT